MGGLFLQVKVDFTILVDCFSLGAIKDDLDCMIEHVFFFFFWLDFLL